MRHCVTFSGSSAERNSRGHNKQVCNSPGRSRNHGDTHGCFQSRSQEAPPPPLLCLATQECTVVLLDVGPRMHPHVEYAARAVSDFLMSKVGWAGVAAV